MRFWSTSWSEFGSAKNLLIPGWALHASGEAKRDPASPVLWDAHVSVVPDPTQAKDVISGVLPAATALTGFVLVFLGLALATLRDARSKGRVAQVYRRSAGLAFIAFLLGVAVIGFSLLWLRGRNATIYSLISWLFAGEVLLVTVSAGIVTWSALRKTDE